ncbi:MAG: c-type cytochrome [Acidobacteriota bacterium]
MGKRSLILCVVILASAILALARIDNARPWQQLQTELFDRQREALRARIGGLTADNASTRTALQAEIAAEETSLEGRRDEIDQLQEDLRLFRGKVRAAELRRDRAQSELAAARWRLAVSAQSAADPTDIQVLQELLRQTRMEIESYGELITDRESKLAAVRAELESAQERWAESRAPIEALQQQLADLGSDRPILGFGSAPIAVRQVAVEEYPIPLPAGIAAERIDRCVTCHLGMTEDLAVNGIDDPVFAGHPRPDLFVAAASPHPYQRFGCTVCHGGQGRAVDFARAGHAARTPEQAAAWSSSWGWQPGEALDPMRPLHLTEASCSGCHDHAIDEAPTLHTGRRLLTQLGCGGCHTVDQPGDERVLRPSGPSLLAIDGKTRPAWVYQWLDAPHEFRPSTQMPHAFGVGNAESHDDPNASDKRSAQIASVVHYLWQHARSPAYPPAAGGDPERGRQLFRTIGCAACHRVEPEIANEPASPHLPGPNLARIGSKVSAEWLQAWLLDPQAVQPGTRMPSMRLDQREAADLTAYLMTRRDPRWDEAKLPDTSIDARDTLVLAYLEQDHSIEASQARLERMSDRDKSDYLGSRTIADKGCHGCHRTPGFEETTSTAPSWTDVGPKVRLGWSPDTHSPSYRLSAGKADAITVAILSESTHPFSTGRSTRERDAALEAGRRVVERHGCRTCHLIEGRGGDHTETSASGETLPDLTHAGARLRSPWLFAYLMDPGRVTLRPWLTTRMPSFALSEAEANALVRYFAVLANRELLAKEAVSSTGAAILSPADLAVGRVVFEMLQCSACHRGGSEHLSLPEVAPAYHHASQRLRPDWVVDWILDPRQWQPETQMPATFLADGEAKPDSSFLIGSISTPIFTVERQRLLRLFGSEDDLQAYLADPERVATALRDYLWTLQD